MSLDDLNQNLYDPDSEIGKRTHRISPFNPETAEKKDAREFQKKEAWVKEKKGLGTNEKKAVKIALLSIGGIALIALLTVGFFWYRKSAFSEERVAVSLDGPAAINSNQTAEYTLKYKNNNRAKLKDAAVILDYAENFQPETAQNLQVLSEVSSKIYLGEISARSEGEVKIKGQFYAPQDYIVYLRVTLEYSPSSLNGRFRSQGQLAVGVKTSPINLEITAPPEAADGNDVEYLVNYRNSSTRTFEEVRVKLEYPDGFAYATSDPRPAEGDSFWYIGTLRPEESGKIKVRGTLHGSLDEGRIVNAYIGSLGSDGKFVTFTQDQKITKMISSPLIITQKVNDLSGFSINAGEKLNYVIEYRNDSGKGLREAIVTMKIESAVIDFSKLELRKGYYDSSKKTIVWKAVDIPELSLLEPGEKGKVEFSVPVLDRIPVKSENDKNFTVFTKALIDSPDIPTPAGSEKIVASSALELKLNSKLALETLGYYQDDKIENSGPLPPEVGKETTYTLRWQITNISNDISGARVVSSLPSGVKWTGKIYPENENISYNERTNEIIWEIGKLKNGTGMLVPKKEVRFQVSITPQVNQTDKEVTLLNGSKLTAVDSFTTEELKAGTGAKATNLTEDPSVGMDYKVKGSS